MGGRNNGRASQNITSTSGLWPLSSDPGRAQRRGGGVELGTLGAGTEETKVELLASGTGPGLLGFLLGDLLRTVCRPSTFSAVLTWTGSSGPTPAGSPWCSISGDYRLC